MTDLITTLQHARRRSVPLIAIETPDQPACTSAIAQALNGEYPALVWDSIQGLRPINEAAASVKLPKSLGQPVELLSAAHSLPPHGAIILQGYHTYAKDPMVSQAVLNLRDLYKSDGRSLLLMGPSIIAAQEINADLLRISDPLPNRERLQNILTEVATAAGQETVPELDLCTDALMGLSSFAAEQAAALAITPTGYNLHELQNRKRQMIQSTSGLECSDSPDLTLDNVIGYAQMTGFLRRKINGKRPPKLILWFDELEKALGTNQDTSGVSQALRGILLTWTEEVKANGVLITGVPGAGKSHTARGMAGTAKCPLVRIDLTAMKGSLVGESETNMRTALQMAAAMGDDGIYMIGTLNDTDETLPAEVKARFRHGTWFYDSPDRETKANLWQTYIASYGLDPEQEIPISDSWVGREIEACCNLADDFDCSLVEAAPNITPVAISDAERLRRMREYAMGRYNSASYPGPYQIQTATERNMPIQDQTPRTRRVDL